MEKQVPYRHSWRAMMFDKFLGAIRDPKTRKALQWLGGGIVIIAGALWVAITTYFPPDQIKENASSPAVQAEGGSIASGRDTKIGGDVRLGEGGGAERE
jgi:hypothetical protein